LQTIEVSATVKRFCWMMFSLLLWVPGYVGSCHMRMFDLKDCWQLDRPYM
jgi:hypothetical protein